MGYLEPEFRAIGANFEDRGAVTDEFLEAMSHLWYDERPAYEGRFVSFSAVDAHPCPVQRAIPVVVGGHTPSAYRRAVARGHGWYGYELTPDAASECVKGLRSAAQTVARPADLEDLEITVSPRAVDQGGRYRLCAGVHRLVVLPRAEADGGAPSHRGRPGGRRRTLMPLQGVTRWAAPLGSSGQRVGT